MSRRLALPALAVLAAACQPAPPRPPEPASRPLATTTASATPPLVAPSASASSSASAPPQPSAAEASAPPIARLLRTRTALAVGYESAAFGLAIRPDDRVVVTGFYRGEDSRHTKALPGPSGFDTFVTELGPDGKILWQRGYGAAFGRGVALDAAGNILLCGEFLEQATFNGTIKSDWINVFFAKLDPAGAGLWVSAVETHDVEHARAIAAGPRGELVAAGQFFGFGRPGTDQLSSHGGADSFVASFDASGKRLFRAGLGTPTDDDVEGVAVAPDGDIFITGFHDTMAGISYRRGSSLGDTSDGFVARLSPQGATRWIHTFGGKKRDGGTAVALDARGHLHLAGIFQGAADFGPIHAESKGLQDIFVAELDGDGTFLAVHGFEGPKDPRALAHAGNNVAMMLKGGGYEAQWLEPPGGAFSVRTLAVHPSGYVAIGGWFFGQARFGEHAFKSDDGADAFVVLLDPKGDVVFADRLGGESNQVVHGLAFDRRGRLVVAGESYVTAFTAWYDEHG
jgi:hypothetical protein